MISTQGPEDVSLLGESPAIVALRREIRDAARTNAKVLILGETGVGKEVVARLIHRGGQRQGRPLVALNCSGIPETLLESELFGHVRGSFTGAYRDKPGLVHQAEGGTLFLDELGEMSLRMQAVLLRFSETGDVQPVGADRPSTRANVRLITATNRDLRAQIVEGKFREDLYYRLNVIQLRVPPVREHPGDIPLLLRHFLGQASFAHGLPCPVLSPEAEAALRSYPWPGNVRELKNLTERLVVRDIHGPIVPDDLPVELLEALRTSARSDADFASGPPLRVPTGSNEIGCQCSSMAETLWQRMIDGDDFWSVATMYKSHDITRADLQKLIHMALQRTHGNYHAVLRLFNLPERDYKRFQAFLFQHKCNLPFRNYRSGDMLRASMEPTPRYRTAS
jgi:DNA-binding NtrC family response regulator